MGKVICLLTICCSCIAMCMLGACGAPQSVQEFTSVPYEGTVTRGDFEITFSVDGSAYVRESGEGLTCELGIKYAGNESDAVIYHGGMPFLLDVVPKPDAWPDRAVTSIGAHTLLKQGETVTFKDMFPWSEKKLAAGEYMLKVWVVFSIDPDAEIQWGDPIFEVPIVVY